MNTWSFFSIREYYRKHHYVLKDEVAFLYCLWFLLSSCGLLFFSLDRVPASFTTPWLLHTAHPLSGVTAQNAGHVHLFAICSGKNWSLKGCTNTFITPNEGLLISICPHSYASHLLENKQTNEWRNKHGDVFFGSVQSLWKLPAASQLLSFPFVPISFFRKRSVSKRWTENSNQHVWLNPKLWFRAKHL